MVVDDFYDTRASCVDLLCGLVIIVCIDWDGRVLCCVVPQDVLLVGGCTVGSGVSLDIDDVCGLCVVNCYGVA